VFLSAGQMTALNNLLDKKAGRDVGFINIADAMSLIPLGLAQRGRAGWTVTAAGLTLGALGSSANR
jgi:hypothetical protein